MSKRAEARFSINIADGSLDFDELDGVGSLFTFSSGSRSEVFEDFLSFCVHESERSAVRDYLSAFVGDLDKLDFRARTRSSEHYSWYRLRMKRGEGVETGVISELPVTELSKLGRVPLPRPRFEQLLDERLGEQRGETAFFVLDIDGFRYLGAENDPERTEALVYELAQTLLDAAPADALCTRLDRGEFVVSCTLSDALTAEKCSAALIAAVERFDATLSAVVGISVSPENGNSMRELLSCADQTLYRLKSDARSRAAAYSDTALAISAAPTERKKSGFDILLNMDWRRLVMLGTAAFCVVLLLCSLVNVYVRGHDRMIEEDSSAYLREISRQINSSVTQAVNSTYYSLQTFARVLSEASDSFTLEELSQTTKQVDALLSCEQIALVTEDKQWFTDKLAKPIASLDQYISACVDRGDVVISSAVELSGGDYIVYMVPTAPFTIEGQTFCAAAALMRVETLAGMLTLTAFDGAGSARILLRDGSTIVRTKRDSASYVGENLFTSMEQMKFADGYSLESLKKNFAAGGEGISRYEYQDEKYIACFSRLAYRDWMLFAQVPQSVIGGRSEKLLRLTAAACIALSVAFSVLLVIVIVVQMRSRRDLEHAAYVDYVTGGASRVKFLLDVKRMLEQRGMNYSLIYTNVQRFKLINDRFGKTAADELLRVMSRIFESNLSPNEACGRINADHFGILLATQEAGEISEHIERWMSLLSGYEHDELNHCTINVTFGVYQIDDKSLEPDLMLDRANLAVRMLGDVGSSGRVVAYYDNRVREKMRFEQNLSDRMEEALSNGEFKMYLQPQYETSSKVLAGFEALVRWQSRDGIIYPNDFIPLFENNGFVVKLDLFMFDCACRFLSRLKDEGLPLVCISVNVSRVHLISDDFMEEYLRIFRRYELEPQYLEFEFTESVIYDNLSALNRIVDQMHSYGFRCAMDDFGAGYSSLNMLHVTNVDKIKLDRSFLGMSPMLSDKGAKIVATLIKLAASLGMDVIAEGVEYEPQFDFLRRCGCKYIQGFYFARPMPQEEAYELIAGK